MSSGKRRWEWAAGLLLPLSLVAFLLGASNAGGARNQETDAAKMPGPLSASHAMTPGSGDCASCHTEKFGIPPDKCLSCHQEIADRITSERGYHKDKGEACAVCHAEHQGLEASLLPLDPGDFDHAETGYLLEGGHARVTECAACHLPEISFPRHSGISYLLPDSHCTACHISPHPGRQFECLACHSMETWRMMKSPKPAGGPHVRLD